MLSSSGNVNYSFYLCLIILFCRRCISSIVSNSSAIFSSCSPLYFSSLCSTNLLAMHFSLSLFYNLLMAFLRLDSYIPKSFICILV